jgi:hypothetical protein
MAVADLRRRLFESASNSTAAATDGAGGGTTGKSGAGMRYTLPLIKEATKNFSKKLCIGYGACGPVYKARLHGKMCAVKVLESTNEYDALQVRAYLYLNVVAAAAAAAAALAVAALAAAAAAADAATAAAAAVVPAF